MTIEIQDTIGTVEVTVIWDVQENQPKIDIDLNVASEVFPVGDCLKALATACERAARDIRAHELFPKDVAHPPISDEEY